MQGTVNLLALGIAGLFLFAWISQCARVTDACEDAGGRAVYEYKEMPSCWDSEGRRIFP